MAHDSDSLITENLHLPLKVAKILAATAGWPFRGVVDFEEIVSAGNLGLVDAARKYDPEKAPGGFAPYAMIRIRGAVYDFLRQVSWAPKLAYEKSKETGVPVKTIRTLGDVYAESDTYSSLSPEERFPTRRHASNINSDGHIRMEKIDNKDAIDYLIKFLRPVDREIVKMYYLEQKTFAQIGKDAGLSESAVCIRLQAIKELCIDRVDSLKKLNPDNFNSNMR